MAASETKTNLEGVLKPFYQRASEAEVGFSNSLLKQSSCLSEFMFDFSCVHHLFCVVVEFTETFLMWVMCVCRCRFIKL